MSMHKPKWGISLAGLVVVIGLPVMGYYVRRHEEPGCCLDGGKIEPAYRVEIVDSGDRQHVFCCLRCAEIWIGRQSRPPRSITVTDETSGQQIAAAEAHYVRSFVVTTPTMGNRVHVFRNRADAEKHAAECRGIILSGPERPFR
jgi:hypothetical protein